MAHAAYLHVFRGLATMPTTDVLILAVARQPGGLTIVGMTPERDATTGLRWVRLVAAEPFDLEELRYADGSIMRPGDVVRLALGEAQPASSHVENVAVELGDAPLERVRRLGGDRRAAFFAERLDPAPRQVLIERSRSLCLVRPAHLTAIIERDEETGHFGAKFAIAIPSGHFHEDGTPKYLRSKEDVVVTDIYWRALMRTWLAGEEFMEVDDAELRERLGEIYVVVGLSPKGGQRILGVHTVPEYDVTLDQEDL